MRMRGIFIVSNQTNVRINTLRGAKMKRTFGYARISTKKQSIERQIRNILDTYPDAIIYQEAYTGTKIERPQFDKMLKQIKEGDTVVFDSVSRMSRNAEEGFQLYEKLYSKGVNLVFLKESYINTDVYREAIKGKVEMTGTDVDCILKGINEYFMILAKKQISIAFEQSQKEVDDLHKRTSEGIETARRNGKQIGQKKGVKLITKKSITAKEIIKKHSKDFNGTLTDIEVMKLTGLARNTYYKYKREITTGA